MKNLIPTGLIAALALGACSQAEAPASKTAAMSKPVATTNDVMKTKTKAVLVYADWCGSCKVLDPKLQTAKTMAKIPGLDYVTLNYTLKDEGVFYAQANEAGVEKAVKDYLDGTIKTGVLLLVDMNDQTVVGKVTKTSEPAEIVTAMKDAVAAS